MRNHLLAGLTVLSLIFTVSTAAAQTALQLRWELVADTHRLVPSTGFAGLAPGATIRIPYLTHQLRNRSFAPAGPYIVFDATKDVGVPLSDYVAAPFERSQGVVTAETQFALDSAIRDIPASDLPPMFPTPVRVTRGTGELRLTAMPQVTAPAELANEAALAAEYLRPYFRARGQGAAVPLRIEVGTVQGQSSPEAYELVIDSAAGIRIVGVSSAGVFYGLQSLRTVLPPPSPRGGLVLPALVFHMHLTDDEGWRVEIPSLPDLTAVGGRRGHTLDSREFLQPAFGSGPQVGRPFGSGFFSHADYVEIVRYAAARHIEVIPEIEMPGHARAAIKAMEARFRATGDPQYRLIDPADTSRYTSVQGYPDNVMNPALESTYRFIERVVGDLVAMHREAGAPLRHIHMGGDEVPGGVWVGSPAVRGYMQAHGLTSVDDLWFVLYGRIEQILKAQGLVPSGWEEIAVRKTSRDGRRMNIPNPDFAARGWRAYVWNNVPGWGAEDLAYRLANGGYDVVLSPVTNYYFDLAWNQNPDDYGRGHIVGIQGNLWSETLGGDGRLDYMTVPKLFGLAERAWAPVPDWARETDSARADSLYREAWSRLVNVVSKRELPRLDREVPGLNYRIPAPGLKAEGGAVYANVELPGFTLRYTTDGSEPTVRSPVVKGPIPLRGRATVRVAAFSTTGRKGHTVRLAGP